MVVHCTIFGNPEPTIKWFKDKIPLNMCTIPRYTIFNHPDDLHEHTIASIIVMSPSYLDNGDYIIEVENEMGFERRVLNVQFQTEDEFNAIYFQKYLEHKENMKYHRYQPGETRWEDIVPEVKEFVFWEPPEEEVAAGQKKKKKKGKIMKTIITPWGDEKQVEVTDEEGSGESDDAEEQQEEEEEEEDAGWNVPGEVAESEGEEETPAVEQPVVAEQPVVEEQPAPVEEPAKEPSPEAAPEAVEEAPVETEKPAEEVAEVSQEQEVAPEEVEPVPEEETQVEDGAYGEELQVEEEPEYREPSEPYVRKEPEVEHPIILRRPKFYITDFQLRKKFYFVNKLIDVEMLKGKTLRMQSVSSSIGPVTCEWRHNGRLIKAPTARKTIEFYPRKNQIILEIENTRVQDSGTYTVTVYNDYTEPLIDSCKVLITVPQPKETADQPPTFTRLLTGINHYRLIKL